MNNESISIPDSDKPLDDSDKSLMESKFARIAQVTDKLNKAADEANELIAAFEDRLGKLGAGVEVWGPQLPREKIVGMNPRTKKLENAIRTTELGFKKFRGGWHFGLRDRTFQEEGAVEIGPNGECHWYEEFRELLSADRQTRIEAIRHIASLLDIIADELERKTNSVHIATEVLTEI